MSTPKYLDSSGLQELWNKIKILDSRSVHKTGDENIDGSKTFKNAVIANVDSSGNALNVKGETVNGRIGVDASGSFVVGSADTDVVIETGSSVFIGSRMPENEIFVKGDEKWNSGEGSMSIIRKGLNGSALGKNSISEGVSSNAAGDGSHAEGELTLANGRNSHAEGYKTVTHGQFSHAENKESVAEGANSHAEGDKTTAVGIASHSEGDNVKANGASSHAEGTWTKAEGYAAHTEGHTTVAGSTASHAEGYKTKSGGTDVPPTGTVNDTHGYAAHAEGQITFAFGPASHAEGVNTIALGKSSHAEGGKTNANAPYSHAEGFETLVVAGAVENWRDGRFAHAEGHNSIAGGTASHAEGNNTVTNNPSEHADGQYNVSHTIDNYDASAVFEFGDARNTIHSVGIGTASQTLHFENSKNAFEIMQNGDAYLYGIGNYVGKGIHADDASIKTLQQVMTEYPFVPGTGEDSAVLKGSDTLNQANGHLSVAIGNNTIAGTETTGGAFAEGNTTQALGDAAHAEGYLSIASGNTSHAEGSETLASSNSAHAEGHKTTASAYATHAEGYESTASGEQSHAEGVRTVASGEGTHAEGWESTASGKQSHAEGNNTTSSGQYSHAEGCLTTAQGNYSHAEGKGGSANGNHSHTEGFYTVASNDYEHAQGFYNKSNTGSSQGARTIHSVGIGANNSKRKNALEVMQNGDVYIINLGGYQGDNASATSVKTLQEVITDIPADANIVHKTGAETIGGAKTFTSAAKFEGNIATDGNVLLDTGYIQTSLMKGLNNFASTKLEFSSDDATLTGNNIYLTTVAGSAGEPAGKVYYGTASPDNEVATVGLIRVATMSEIESLFE